jgi:hypothetical protein
MASHKNRGGQKRISEARRKWLKAQKQRRRRERSQATGEVEGSWPSPPTQRASVPPSPVVRQRSTVRTEGDRL